MEIKERFKTTKLVHMAMMLSLIVSLVLVGTMLTDPKAPKNEGSFDTFKYILLIVIPALIIASNFIGKSAINQVQDKSIEVKMAGYQAFMVIKNALFEAGGFFAVIAVFLANAHVFFAGALIMLVMMYINRPTVTHISKTLGLDSSEQMELERALR